MIYMFKGPHDRLAIRAKCVTLLKHYIKNKGTAMPHTSRLKGPEWVVPASRIRSDSELLLVTRSNDNQGPVMGEVSP